MSIGYAKDMGEVSWVWVCKSYILAEDPSTVTAALSEYYAS